MHARLTKENPDQPAKTMERDASTCGRPTGPVHVKDKTAEFPTAQSSSSFPDLKHLTTKLQKDLEKRMPEGLFSEKTGRTEVIQHDIHLLSPGSLHQTYCSVLA